MVWPWSALVYDTPAGTFEDVALDSARFAAEIYFSEVCETMGADAVLCADAVTSFWALGASVAPLSWPA